MKLSVVMPVYNERATLRAVVERVLAVPLDIELLCVDDGSKDGSREILAELQSFASAAQVFFAAGEHGEGCGAAAGDSGSYGRFRHHSRRRSGIRSRRSIRCCSSLCWKARPTLCMARGFSEARPHRVLYFWHSVGNSLLTLLSNCLTNINLSDMETCYKVFRREIIQSHSD